MKTSALALATIVLAGATLVHLAAQQAPTKPAPAASADRAPGAGRARAGCAVVTPEAATGRRARRAALRRVAKRSGRHLLRHLPQRARQSGRAVAGRLHRDEGAGAARGRREDDPQAARRDDAAGRRQAARRRDPRRADHRARRPHGRDGVGQSEPRLAAVPAPQSRRIRRRGQGPAAHRRRRHHVPAARHHQPRLRQRRRRAGLLPVADGRLPAGRRPHRHAGAG